MTRVDLRGIHRVHSGGREYHYAWRGGPRFWSTASPFAAGSAEYLAALAAAAPPPGQDATGKFRAVILAWLGSGDFAALAPRTRRDFHVSINHPDAGIDAKFGGAPLGVFNDPRIRGQVLAWRDAIGGRQGDARVRHLQRIVGWALDRGHLRAHHLRDIAALYRADRAGVIWLPAEIEAFEAGAPQHVSRILTSATETGLRPGDLVGLGPAHVHPTPRGRRIVVWTRKRSRLASIPVTPRMAALIDATPPGQQVFLVTAAGTPWAHENQLGAAVSHWRDELGLRSALRLYDARGTAATRLLAAGAELREIATHMGWSLRHAASVIEAYVALAPEMTDAVGGKLARLDRKRGRKANAPVKPAVKPAG